MTRVLSLKGEPCAGPLRKSQENLKLNIARIAKTALHKLPGKSSLNVRSVCPCVLSVLSVLITMIIMQIMMTI